MMAQPAHPRGRSRSVLHLLPQSLSASWIAVSALYLSDYPKLPEPVVALIASVVVGVVAAFVQATGDPAATRPRRGRQLPAASANREQTQPVQRFESDTAATRPTSPADLARYSSATTGEFQCPRCGGFDIAQLGVTGQPTHLDCRVCGLGWSPDRATPPPDVVVRSWLHR
jgi:hypothetical protein